MCPGRNSVMVTAFTEDDASHYSNCASGTYRHCREFPFSATRGRCLFHSPFRSPQWARLGHADAKNGIKASIVAFYFCSWLRYSRQIVWKILRVTCGLSAVSILSSQSSIHPSPLPFSFPLSSLSPLSPVGLCHRLSLSFFKGEFPSLLAHSLSRFLSLSFTLPLPFFPSSNALDSPSLFPFLYLFPPFLSLSFPIPLPFFPPSPTLDYPSLFPLSLSFSLSPLSFPIPLP